MRSRAERGEARRGFKKQETGNRSACACAKKSETERRAQRPIHLGNAQAAKCALAHGAQEEAGASAGASARAVV